ncbi:calcium permeable stress-gated cation channel 1-like [Halichondria panicea]|uniref:calcium permeable stress-gated cation channel 1-like n=1 Tax=Halichondria panicea TaxID=6063 RepID=UPI00312B4EFA
MGWSVDLVGNSSTNSCSRNPLLDMNDNKIVQLLGLAAAAWVAQLLLFLIMRCCAPDYTRAGLATSKQWITAMYNRQKEKLVGSFDARSKSWSTLLYEDKHWYTWIVNFFWKLKLSDIRSRCGPDASVYLRLELYLVLLLTVVSFLSLGVILPINYTAGGLGSSKDVFPRTTISNVPSESGVLWVHTAFSLVYLCLAVVFMVHFSLRLGKLQQDYSNHTVMVEWIPPLIHREDLMQHLQEALPNSPVSDIQMAYDVTEISNLSNKLQKVTVRMEEVDSIRSELGIRETVQLGWRKLFCCTDRFETDARAYLEGEYSQLKASVKAEKRRVRNHKKMGIAFITFKREQDARDFYTSYKPCRPRPHSSMYNSVNARWWWVSMAPFPLDINWSNLSMPYVIWWMRWLLINIILFVFLFFFTTPPVIIASIDEIRTYFVNISNNTDIPDLHTAFGGELAKISVSTLLLLLCSSLLPLIVSRTSYLEAHWTMSFREQTIMRKTYIFLVLMVIILPSIGMTSLSALAELALDGETAIQSRLQCVFLPNNGAFFVSYAIIAVFVRTGLDLLRIPELLVYLAWRARAKTRRQRENALNKAANFNFLYGVHYAWNLVLFNLIISFSLTTPLITPIGVLYFLIKHYVDRYNIYYVYKPAPFQGRQFIHRSAINFVIVGAVHLQLFTLFFSIVRLGRLDPRSVLMMVTFTLTCVLCIGTMFFGWFKHLIPQLQLRTGKEYRVFGETRSGGDEEESCAEGEGGVIAKGSYIAPVLRDGLPTLSADNSITGFGYQSFGSTDLMGRRSPSVGPSSSTGATTRATNQMSTLERSVKGGKQRGEAAFGEGAKYLV